MGTPLTVADLLDRHKALFRNELGTVGNLAAILEKLEAAGVRLKKSKYHFVKASVEYLGHKISDKGIQPTEAKIRAIVKAPAPNNVSQLKAFLDTYD